MHLQPHKHEPLRTTPMSKPTLGLDSHRLPSNDGDFTIAYALRILQVGYGRDNRPSFELIFRASEDKRKSGTPRSQFLH